MIITSLTNAKVIEASKLTNKKYRDATGRYLIEGVKLLNEAINRGVKIVSVFVRQSDCKKYAFENQITLSDNVFTKLANTVTSQGVIAVCEKNPDDESLPSGNALILDGLQDPGNVGALIRTAAACGFSDVYAVNSVDLYAPKVLRSAMSAHFCVKLHQRDDLSALYDTLSDYKTVIADMDGECVFNADFNGRIALVVGNEGNGISGISKDRADMIVSLPMANNFESLNVAVAGSVIMYQIYMNRN